MLKLTWAQNDQIVIGQSIFLFVKDGFPTCSPVSLIITSA